MFIDFNQIARLGKLIALLGFFLPWVTVSCSNTEILSATGWQLMTGDPQPAGPLEGFQDNSVSEDAEPAPFVVAAFGIILIGLICSFFTRTQTAAATMLACAVLGIGVSYYAVENMRTELRREMSERSEEAPEENSFFSAEQQRQLSQSVASSITVKEEEGYVVTHTGLLIAAIFSLLTLFRRKKPEQDPREHPA